MPDTERYQRWIETMTASDRVLLQLIGLALLAVVGWELLRALPEPWQGRARLLYLAGALGLLMTALAGRVSTAALVLAGLSLSAGGVVARAAWLIYQRRTSAPTIQTGEQSS